jgi:hypothetical protein
MWYRIIKSSFGLGKQIIPNVIQPEPEIVEEDEMSPLYTSLESQLNNIRPEDQTSMNMYQKGKGGLSLLNGEGEYRLKSGKGATMFFDNMPSDRTLI